jgi:hypothetical protein
MDVFLIRWSGHGYLKDIYFTRERALEEAEKENKKRN